MPIDNSLIQQIEKALNSLCDAIKKGTSEAVKILESFLSGLMKLLSDSLTPETKKRVGQLIQKNHLTI